MIVLGRAGLVIVGFLALMLSAGSAFAEKRVALVLGNSAYLRVTKLPNPENDANDMADALRALNFDVIFRSNADRRGMDSALEEFERKAAGADTALFFFAGHGLQYRGRNYLLPIDADLEDEVSLRYNTLAIDKVREALDAASGVKIMVLDACRNNPLSEQMVTRSAGLTRSASVTRGLARLDRTEGMVVAYATQADQVAQDGSGRNSPFSSALIHRLNEPNLEIATLFRRVAQDVYEQTGGKQRPELSISLLQDFYLNLRDDDSRVWRRLNAKPDISESELQDFITKFPSSAYARDAQSKLYVLRTLRTEREAISRQLADLKAAREELDRRDRERQIANRKEEERHEQERAELDRVAIESRARAQAEASRLETERHATEKRDVEKAEAARLLAERRDQEQADAKRAAAEALERSRMAAQKREADRMEAERLAVVARETARAEAERLATARKAAEAAADSERDRKRLETDRLVAEKKEADRAAAEKKEADRREAQRVADAELLRQQSIRVAALEAEGRRKAEAEQARAQQAELCKRETADIAALTAGKQSDALASLKPTLTCPGLVASIDKAIGDIFKARERACSDDARALGKIGRDDVATLKVFVIRATCDSVKQAASERVAALETERGQREAACTNDGARLSAARAEPDALVAASSLRSLQASLTCEGLRQDIAAALKLVDPSLSVATNSPEQIKSAQMELQRIGCFVGDVSGTFDPSTRIALGAYGHAKRSEMPQSIGDGLLASLKGEIGQVCKLEPTIASIPPAAPEKAPQSKPSHRHVAAKEVDEDEAPARKHKPSRVEPPRHVEHAAAPVRAPARAPVAARAAPPPGPTASSGHASQAIGVGF